MVRKLNPVNSPVRHSANHATGGSIGATANRPSIDTAISTAATATDSPRQRRTRCASHPSAGSCTTSISRSPASTAPRAASPTP